MAIVNRKKVKIIISELQKEGNKIVFTNGCFDILHRGHIEYLKQAKQLADYLVIGLNIDDSVKRLKGKTRPLQTESDRAEILNSLRFVDFVIIFNENTPLELIRELKPDVLVKGGDYDLDSIVGAKDVLGWSGAVKIIPFLEGYGTSKLIEKIVDN